MSIHVALNHRTVYRFDRPVVVYPHVIRLRPAPHCRTPVLSYSLTVEPRDHFINWQQDAFGNYVARLNAFESLARALTIEVDLHLDLTVINPFEFFLEEDAREFPFEYDRAERRDLAPYLDIATESPRLDEWLASLPPLPTNTVDMLVALNQAAQQAVDYTIRMEPGVQKPDETLDKALGSCRDSAWMLAEALRRKGLAARFVSGYLVQLTADQAPVDSDLAGPAADFTDLHAWTEVYVPGAGWIGLDPTSGLLAGEGHIPLACTPGTGSAAPVTGATGKCEVEFEFSNTVTRIHEDARVTRPLTDEGWSRVAALGHQVDEVLRSEDVRLTMGGEPTFVATGAMDEPEWSTEADGRRKRALAGRLFEALAQQTAPAGAWFFGQGKWYPGEPLPRWQKTVYFRVDGQPLWRHTSLRAQPADVDLLDAPPGRAALDQNDGRRLVEALEASLGLQDAFQPAYEDAFHAAWQAGNLPLPAAQDADHANTQTRRKVDAAKAEAAAILAELDRAGQPVAWVLPLAWEDGSWGFVAGRWAFRRGRLTLTPGDSPAGLRLPLTSLFAGGMPPPETPGTEPQRDPWDVIQPAASLRAAATDSRQQQRCRWVSNMISTALCVEVRPEGLCVFMPPLPHLEAWEALLQLIEAAAEATGLAVILEGYPPPSDPRIKRLSVTPDPGVIEVNVQPASSWEELCEVVEPLYETARQLGLSTEKFMHDGRHTGTGGGNHVTIGGHTPADSPLLRRPHLLASMIRFWQTHPSLSYLFSGTFIGPTSQAPRVDESRPDSLYELEIALSEIEHATATPPWLVDRALRHHLTDLTGNTHRSEFCIDKLYSPDSASGRLGLLELRGFEMPPHARMSLLQMLLIRALVAHFWKAPCRRRLVRWETALIDRFMLPHFVWQDFLEVLDTLRESGFEFDPEWFEAFMEFRFPRYGQLRLGPVELELRGAIEPWHVLGEELTAAGTARFVDSSVERLQVKVTGLNADRHILLCNGRRVPLVATGRRDESVAGVRFQAWQPPSSLNPTIPIQVPLIFDVVDAWNHRSLGGCRYYVDHPGGRNPDIAPINAVEAESRRMARFQPFGYTPGPVHFPPAAFVRRTVDALPPTEGILVPPDVRPDPECPGTLDLRRHRLERPS